MNMYATAFTSLKMNQALAIGTFILILNAVADDDVHRGVTPLRDGGLEWRSLRARKQSARISRRAVPSPFLPFPLGLPAGPRRAR